MRHFTIFAVCLAFVGVSCSEKHHADIYESIDRIEASVSGIFIPSIQSNPDSAIAVLGRNSELESNPLLGQFWKIGQAKAYYMLYRDGDAIKKNGEVIAFCDSVADMEGLYALIAETENLSGVLEQQVNNRESACRHYIKAYESAKKTPRVKNLPTYCVNIADNYRMMSRYADAASWLRQALSIVDSLKLESFYPPVYTQLGQVYSYLKNYDRADEYFSRALPYCTKGDFDNFFYLISKGNSLFGREEYEEALECFRKALPIGKNLNISQEKLVEANMCEVFVSMKQLDSADFYFKRAYEFYNTAVYYDDAVLNHLRGLKGAIELERNNPAQASIYLSYGIEDSRRHDVLDFSHYRRMERLAEMKGDWKTAAFYAKKMYAITDSSFSAILKSNFVEAESRYERDTTIIHQQLRLSEQTARIGRLSGYLYFFIIIVLVCVAFIAVITYRKQKKEHKTEQELALLRLESLRRLVSPHYIFNALYAANPEDRILRPLTSLMRNSIDTSASPCISLARELEITRDGVSLRKVLGREDVSFIICKEGQVKEDIMVFPGCISTFVENSYKHAFPPEIGKPEIVVKLFCSEGSLIISVRDNGCGMPSEAHKGTGLQNLPREMEILNAYNVRQARMEIRSEKGTEVIVTIPDGYKFNIE